MISTRRIRWGVQYLSGDEWRTLGASWHMSHVTIPDHVDHWPMSFPSRRLAREQARQLQVRSRNHTPPFGWRFRVVKVELVTRELP